MAKRIGPGVLGSLGSLECCPQLLDHSSVSLHSFKEPHIPGSHCLWASEMHPGPFSSKLLCPALHSRAVRVRAVGPAVCPWCLFSAITWGLWNLPPGLGRQAESWPGSGSMAPNNGLCVWDPFRGAEVRWQEVGPLALLSTFHPWGSSKALTGVRGRLARCQRSE